MKLKVLGSKVGCGRQCKVIKAKTRPLTEIKEILESIASHKVYYILYKICLLAIALFKYHHPESMNIRLVYSLPILNALKK